MISPSTKLEKAHILYVDTVTALGGAQLSLLELAAGLDRKRFEPFLVAPDNGPLSEEFVRCGGTVLVCDVTKLRRSKPWSYVRIFWQLKTFVNQKEIDLIHGNGIAAMKTCAMLSLLYQAPAICDVNDVHGREYDARQVRWLALPLKKVIATSEAVRKALTAHGVPESKIEVIYDGVDLSIYDRAVPNGREKVRGEFSVGPNTVLVGIVGQLEPRKGHLNFLKAAGLLRPHLKDVRFIMVGADIFGIASDYARMVVEYAKQSGLNDIIMWAGFRRDVPEIMAALDILTMPSLREPFGRVAIEAMAAGRPVVASNVDGVPEIVEHGRTGLLVPPGSPEALAGAIRQLVEQPSIRQAMGAAGRRKIEEQFTLQIHLVKMQALYTQVLDGRD